MTLKRRLYISYGIALFLVILIGALSLYFINSLGVEIQSLVGSTYPGLDALLARTQKDLILILLVVLVGGVVILFIAPYRAALPLKRLFMAFREAEEGNLSVRLSTEGTEEMTDFSRTFNRFMGQLEDLDDKRVKKIAFEQRRFETLANLLDAAVFVSNVEGQFLFANSQVFRAFNLSTKQLIGVSLDDVPLPKPFMKLVSESIARKERIEDMPWELTFEKDGAEVRCPLVVDILPIARHTGELVNLLIILEERDKPRAERIFRREGR